MLWYDELATDAVAIYYILPFGKLLLSPVLIALITRTMAALVNLYLLMLLGVEVANSAMEASNFGIRSDGSLGLLWIELERIFYIFAVLSHCFDRFLSVPSVGDEKCSR